MKASNARPLNRAEAVLFYTTAMILSFGFGCLITGGYAYITGGWRQVWEVIGR